MKKIIGLFTFIWAASLLFAQQPSGSVSFQNNADSVIMSVIGNLDFSEVSTDLLQERTIPWVDLSLLDGETLSDSNLINHNSYGLIYATVSGMGLNGAGLPDPSTTYMPLLEDMNSSADTFPISALFYQYDYIRPDAVSSNLLAWTTNAGGGAELSRHSKPS